MTSKILGLWLLLTLTCSAATANSNPPTDESAMYHPITRLKNCRIIREREIMEDDLWLSGGKIVQRLQRAEVEVDMEGKIIAPGFIDIQINGAFGVDFTTEPEKVAEVAAQLPRFGVTSFLPTIVSTTTDKYTKAIPLLAPRRIQKGADILGVHLEGPFLNPECVGAHEGSCLQKMPNTYADLEKIYGTLDGVKVITLAPDLPGALKMIKELDKRAFIVSAGHSNASLTESTQAMEAGVRLTTHLFNAMRGLHHREPGLVGATLMNPKQYYSMICDTVHLHPHTVSLAYKAHPEGAVVVSDGISAMGLEPGTYSLGGQQVVVDVLTARVKGGQAIAGSICPLSRSLKHFKEATGCSLIEAIETVTLHPAKLLRVDHTKGTLSPGADADFVVLDDNLNIEATVVGGETVWGTL